MEELILATLDEVIKLLTVDEVIKLLRQFGKELDETNEKLNQIQPSEREIEIRLDPKELASAIHHDIQNGSE